MQKLEWNKNETHGVLNEVLGEFDFLKEKKTSENSDVFFSFSQLNIMEKSQMGKSFFSLV